MRYLNKLIESGLYLLVFLLPMQTRWIIKEGELNGGHWEYGTYSLYATDILLLAILLLFSYYNYTNTKIKNFELRIIGVWWFIWGLILISAVSILFASNKPLALFKFSWLILGVGLFWLMVNANYSKLKLIWSLLAGVFVQASLGIWQFLNQSSFSNKWLGLACHQASLLGTSVIEITSNGGIGERWLRAYGGVDHPNILGGIVVVGMILIIYQLLKGNKGEKFSTFQPKADNYQFSKSSQLSILKEILIPYFLFFIFFITLVFTFSRTAWLAFIIALIAIITFVVRKRDLIKQRKVLEIVLASSILFFILFNLYNNLFLTRLQLNQRLEIKSTSERIESYKSFYKLIKDSWLSGVGIGNYTLEEYDIDNIKQLTNLINRVEKKSSWYYQPVHNTFLLIWSEVGLIGLVLFIGLIINFIIFDFSFLICKQNVNYCNNDKLFNLIMLIVLIIIMLFDHWLWSLHFGVLFFWLIIGLVNKKEDKRIVKID